MIVIYMKLKENSLAIVGDCFDCVCILVACLLWKDKFSETLALKESNKRNKGKGSWSFFFHPRRSVPLWPHSTGPLVKLDLWLQSFSDYRGPASPGWAQLPFSLWSLMLKSLWIILLYHFRVHAPSDTGHYFLLLNSFYLLLKQPK